MPFSTVRSLAWLTQFNVKKDHLLLLCWRKSLSFRCLWSPFLFWPHSPPLGCHQQSGNAPTHAPSAPSLPPPDLYRRYLLRILVPESPLPSVAQSLVITTLSCPFLDHTLPTFHCLNSSHPKFSLCRIFPSPNQLETPRPHFSRYRTDLYSLSFFSLSTASCHPSYFGPRPTCTSEYPVCSSRYSRSLRLIKSPVFSPCQVHSRSVRNRDGRPQPSGLARTRHHRPILYIAALVPLSSVIASITARFLFHACHHGWPSTAHDGHGSASYYRICFGALFRKVKPA